MQTFCGITTDGMLDYLAATYKLAEQAAFDGRNGDKVTTSALADKMHVSPAAASSMLKRLEESNFIERSNVDGITLTEQGRLAALQLVRRHRLLEVFLVQVMGYTWDQVDAEAHRLEHAVSGGFEERIDQLCNHPTHCPHGDPIPRKDGALPDEPLLPLVALLPGQRCVLRRVGTSDARILRYLGQLELRPGQSLRLVDLAPFGGPVTLELLNGPHADQPTGTQMLGSELAARLFVAAHPVAHPAATAAEPAGSQTVSQKAAAHG